MTNKELARMLQDFSCEIYEKTCPAVALKNGDREEVTKRTSAPKTWAHVIEVLREFATQIEETPDNEEFKPTVQLVLNDTCEPIFTTLSTSDDDINDVWYNNYHEKYADGNSSEYTTVSIPLV